MLAELVSQSMTMRRRRECGQQQLLKARETGAAMRTSAYFVTHSIIADFDFSLHELALARSRARTISLLITTLLAAGNGNTTPY